MSDEDRFPCERPPGWDGCYIIYTWVPKRENPCANCTAKTIVYGMRHPGWEASYNHDMEAIVRVLRVYKP
jgi:hypothetical protein